MIDTFSALIEWIKISSAEEFWTWTVILLIATTASFFSAFKYIHKKRIIEDTPTSKIRSAAQGYLELVGHGQLMEGQAIVSPLTGAKCTWYEYKIEEHRGSGDNSKWVVIKQETSDELFLIKDGTGQCIIDPEGAHVTSKRKDVWYGGQSFGGSSLPTSRKRGFLNSISIGNRGNKYRYSEKLLHAGETLYAIGLYKTVGGAGSSFDVNEDVRELIREWKRDSETLMKKFDTNGDGEIDLNEWQRVRDEAYAQVMEKHSEQKTLPPLHLMNRTNDKRRPFILSALAEDDLTRRLHIYSTSSIIAFAVCGSLTALLIGTRLAS